MKYFGTDGFRGEANKGLTVDHAFKIGRYVGWYYGARQERKARVVVGKDTRRSSYMFESALVAGLVASGADAYLLHVIPTPGVAYETVDGRFDCGIMISASHNPYTDNGIKLVNGEGYKMDEDVLELIEAYIDGEVEVPLATGDAIGCTVDYMQGRNRYIAHLIASANFSLQGVKVGLDCANGAASSVAKPVFDALGADVRVINNAPDGFNINVDCGSTHLANLQKLVREEKLDVGFAFDGDADRCLAVDENGELVDGDKLIAIFSSQMKREGKLANDTAVVTVMSNMGFFKFAEQAGIHVEKTSVGDRYVLQNMLEHGHCIGGEQSGHIIFREFMTTGDGQLTAVQLLRAIKKSGKKLSELAQLMQVYPQVILNVRADKEMKRMVKVDEGVLKRQQQLEEGMNGNGRILVRPSGTEPVIRIMVEGLDREAIMNAAKSMEQIIIERLGYNEDCKGLERI